MRAIGIRAFGGVDALEAVTVESMPPGPGDVRVSVAYAGVSLIDIHARQGFAGQVAPGPKAEPLVCGFEGSGTVLDVGPGVEGFMAGDRVAWCGVAGSYAEHVNVPAWRLVALPDDLPFDVACALQLDGLLAHTLAVSVFPVQTGDRVLIQGGADTVALLLTQIVKSQGAEVVATVGTEADVGGPLAAGADYVVVLEAGLAREEIQEATQGQGCHVVYDGLGQNTLALSKASARRRGMLVVYGSYKCPVDQVSMRELADAGSLFVTRPRLSDFMQDRTEILWRWDGLLASWRSGNLKTAIGRILPLAAAREAHLTIEAGGAAGKILLRV